MTEFIRPSLLSFNAEQSVQAQAYESRVKELQRAIQWQVNITVSEYQLGLPELYAQATNTIETVIQPWWQQLHQSGVLEKFRNLARTKAERRVLLSNSRPYLYPKEALRIVSLATERDIYRQEAESQLRISQLEGLPEYKRNYRELYQGRFYLNAGNNNTALSYTYGTPNGPSGFVGGMAENSRLLTIDIEKDEDILEKIHPQPLIDLGKEILSYDVSDRIEAYLVN